MLPIQKELRKKLIRLYHEAGAGHIACSLSCIDILHTLFKIKTNGEKVILSKGHAAAALYIVLRHFNEISDLDLNSFYKDGTKLSAHPTAFTHSEIPFALGSLGHGLPIAAGMAYSNKADERADFTYVLMSDGETNEGTTWEAAHFAVRHKLDNLIVIIDKNNIQGFDFMANVLGDTANVELFKIMGFDAIETDGHDLAEITTCISHLKETKNGRPKLIIANTIKGKGVKLMENKVEWHYLPLNEHLFGEALLSIENY